MADLATLTARRDALEEARAKGILTAEYDGKRITYKDDAQMAAALASLNTQIQSLSGTRINTVVFETSKGLS